MAEAAGVHAATASRALNPATRGLVNAETARRVMKVAETLGYRPNPIARGLKTSKSGTVGLVIPDLTNPLFPPIVRGIEDVLEPAGYSGLIVNTDNDPGRERAQIELAALPPGRGADRRHRPARAPAAGAAAPRGRPDGDGQPAPRRHRRPVDHARRRDRHRARRRAPRRARAPPDRPPRRPAEHLDRRGPRPRVPQHRPRAAVSTTTRRWSPRASYWNEEAGADALRGLLDRGVDFTAVVAGNDLIALGCYDVFAERGIDCPDDVSVVGFNDMPFLDKLRPPLTTVAIPHQQIGAEAARMLLDTIAEPDRPARSVLLPLSLVVRGSTAPPPG